MADRHDEERSDASAASPAVDEHDDFLARWSRRKTIARQGGELTEPPLPADTASAPPAASGTVDDVPDEPQDGPTEAPELPPLESLDEDSDYSAFLHADVSTDVQREALRKLFRSPKFNVRDGLDDYDFDYSKPEPLGNIVTAEMRHRIRQELERLADRIGDAEADSDTAVAADTTGDEPVAPEAEPGPDHEPTETS